jgi:hypothetical protein
VSVGGKGVGVGGIGVGDGGIGVAVGGKGDGVGGIGVGVGGIGVAVGGKGVDVAGTGVGVEGARVGDVVVQPPKTIRARIINVYKSLGFISTPTNGSLFGLHLEGTDVTRRIDGRMDDWS